MSAPFTHPIEVRFRDLDALGHVNNAVYLTYLESARIAYWLHVTRRSGLDALDMILARVEIDYRSPLSYGEAVDVTVRCASMRRSSFVLEFAARERAAGRLVADTDALDGRSNDTYAEDEGISGGASSAEEAAVHVVEEP